MNEEELKNWPKNQHGHFICTKDKPMPEDFPKGSRWEHDDVHETDTDNEWYIEYRCHSCLHVWKSEMPE